MKSERVRPRTSGVSMEMETITKVPVDRLRLDRESPRLAGEAVEATDEWIVARLHRSTGWTICCCRSRPTAISTSSRWW